MARQSSPSDDEEAGPPAAGARPALLPRRRHQRGRAHRARRGAGHGARHRDQQQRLGAADPGHPGRAVVRMAVPQGGVHQRPPRCLDDGHPGLDRCAHRLPVVGLRGADGRVVRRRGHGRWCDADPEPLVRERHRRDHLPALRALDGGPRDRPHPRCAARAAQPGRQGRRRRADRPGHRGDHRGAHPHRPAARERAVPRPARREGRHRRPGGRGQQCRRRVTHHR